jgi:membrane protease YdiL (CAAX protease family)
LGSQGWIFVALVYAVVQLQWGSPLHGLFALGASLFYGLMVKATGSIAGVCISHGLLNIGLYLVFPHVF